MAHDVSSFVGVEGVTCQLGLRSRTRRNGTMAPSRRIPPPTMTTKTTGLPSPNCEGGTKLMRIAAADDTIPMMQSRLKAGAR